eukprot:scaffold21612_cov115-Isochrysis_galbana.AAC.1
MSLRRFFPKKRNTRGGGRGERARGGGGTRTEAGAQGMEDGDSRAGMRRRRGAKQLLSRIQDTGYPLVRSSI